MKKTKLDIKTLGGFEIICNDKEITLGRNRASKYIQLVARVFTAGSEGVSKEDLQDDIYSEDLNVKSNLNNSMNNLIYQFRKVAEKAGIPGGNVVAFSDGVYKAAPEVDAVTDTVEFVRYINAARNASDYEEKAENYQKAFDLYKGDFLPELNDLYWISKKSEDLRTLYEECVDFLADFYKSKKNYVKMARVFHNASVIDPDCEWQVGEINAYRHMKDYKKAYILYEEMIRYYAEELGITPTENMQRCYQKLQDAAFSGTDGEEGDVAAENSLKNGLLGEDEGGPYECLFPEMSASYHILSRNMERHGLTVFLLLLTIADYEGKEIRQEEKAERRMETLKDAINETLRHGDAFCKYSRTQYLVLLTGTGVEECMLVHRRLQDRLKVLAGPRASLNYRIISYADMTAESAGE
ncbi:bacterial transcriptional activator domain-containing protein [Butyrivibrio sp. LC3010]|uniref:bacterial transcriptional activator domain-containing protein n=1 Tax=Butyrivibrio sp. LC3010 TaxID=1280680 RepID=UPI000479BC27|nr:bacterial transcriptional activator domain-containing protein [Butyrivibrio sp. LC3010]